MLDGEVEDYLPFQQMLIILRFLQILKEKWIATINEPVIQFIKLVQLLMPIILYLEQNIYHIKALRLDEAIQQQEL